MYLLNRDCDTANLTIVIFTFHYVSIKSVNTTTGTAIGIGFTFHYVSIKSLHNKV